MHGVALIGYGLAGQLFVAGLVALETATRSAAEGAVVALG